MNATRQNKAWNLQSFLDSLIFELDKARDTLAIKGMNKPMTYAVKDLSLDLQLFPEFDGNEVRFMNAKPGDTGASKISISLGSITDRQIRETTRVSVDADDLSLDEVEELEPEVKDSLKKIGVSSISDIENLEARNIDLDKLTPVGGAGGSISELAAKLKSLRNKKQTQKQLSLSQSQRAATPPLVKGMRMVREGDFMLLTLEGSHLGGKEGFQPFATLNDVAVEVVSVAPEAVRIRILGSHFQSGENHLRLALDPFAILQLKLQ